MEAATLPDMMQHYVERGLFRNFQASSRKDEFAFNWLNHDPMLLQWKSSSKTVLFKDILPKIAARSTQDREVRAFLKSRCRPELPAHRRVDPEAFDLVCINRNSQISIGLRIKDGTEEKAMRTLLALVHETFIFLNDRWAEYMYQEFGSPLE